MVDLYHGIKLKENKTIKVRSTFSKIINRVLLSIMWVLIAWGFFYLITKLIGIMVDKI